VEEERYIKGNIMVLPAGNVKRPPIGQVDANAAGPLGWCFSSYTPTSRTMPLFSTVHTGSAETILFYNGIGGLSCGHVQACSCSSDRREPREAIAVSRAVR
jgi:hypothetical protein